MTLKQWFQKNASRPLYVAAGFVGLVWVVLLVALLSEISYQQKEGTRQLANLLSLSFSQMNRVLTESLLESTHVNLQAHAAVVCQGNKAIVSANADNGDCTRSGSWLYPKIAYDIPGSSEYRVIATFSKFGDRASIWQFFLFGLIFTGGCFVLLYKIKQRFLNDIFLPLQSGIYNDTPMPIEEFEQVRQKRKLIEEAKGKDAVLQAVLENKSKVAHNIKSPLRTLRSLQEAVQNLVPASDLKLLDGAIYSITNILGDQQKDFVRTAPASATSIVRATQGDLEPLLLSDFLEEAVAQKSAEYSHLKKIRISLRRTDSSCGVFVNAVKFEFVSIISNLINNAVDAIGPRRGDIEVAASVENNKIIIRVSDSGGGIREDQREKIFEKGVTSKAGGTGYGLYHARQYLERWGGQVECRQPLNSGATFEIALPTAKPPSWFAECIDVRNKKNIVVLDDDVLTHKVWVQRFQGIVDLGTTKILTATNESDFEKCIDQIGPEISESIILCDFDLGVPGRTGLDIVKAFGVTTLATMVTNSFQSTTLIQECMREDIRILPKPCIHSVAISV